MADPDPASTDPAPPVPAPPRHRGVTLNREAASTDPAAPSPAPASPVPATYDDFSKIELRVAKVLEARPHPNADKLMLLQIDVGDATKQIVAGIRQHTTPEALVGKLIVVVNNLAPAMLRGETSNGMLLAATSGDRVILLTVDDPDCVVGAKIK